MATIVAGEEPYSRDPAVSEWRNPANVSWSTHRKGSRKVVIAMGGAPRELKHLSNARNINRNEIPLVAASERGTV